MGGVGDICYVPDFFAPARADELFAELRRDLEWRQECVRIGGRSIPQPRLTCWYGDPGTTYTYSGLTLTPLPWTSALAELRAELNAYLATDLRAVLGNLYRTGADSVGWHADNEPELGTQPVIASLSFGASRRFDMRRRSDHTRRRSYVLEHGSLLVMAGMTQQHWQHQLPKTAAAVGERINLSFRTRVCE